MKNHKILLQFCFILVFVLSVNSIDAKERPYGTVKVTNDVYFDETEIDVGSWLSYYSWVLVHEGKDAAQKVLPDKSAIEDKLWTYINNNTTDYIASLGAYSLQPIGNFGKECEECVKFGERLFKERRYCAMLNFPITGVSYEQAVGFCEWRTKVLGNNKFVFRLPTPDEWKDFALIGLSDSERKNGTKDSLDNKKCLTYNFNSSCKCWNDEFKDKLLGVGLNKPDKKGAFDVFGNVSEMTSVKGNAKGGNFRLHASQCHPDSTQNYKKPEIWLGFRCIAVKATKGMSSNNSVRTEPVNEFHLESTSAGNHDSDDKFGVFTDPRDGKTYPTVLIGTQTWLAANLAYKPESGRYWAYAKEQNNVDKYGYLYSWEISKDACPVGWHIPSKEEFEILVQTIGGDSNEIYKKLVPSGSSGFAVVSAGLRFDMDFTPIDGGSAFWSSSENKKKWAWGFTVGRLEPKAYIDDGWYKNYGLSIRCIKDK